MKKTNRLLQGSEACAEGALAAGLGFFAAYPISPASEIAEYLAQHLPGRGGVFIQMEDEIATLSSVIGASLAGAKAMTATSGPGFSLMQEALGYAAMAEIPCVVVNVQRLGPSTGRPTSPAQGDVMQARWGTHGDHPVVVMSPAWVQEIFTATVEAFNIAEELRLPVVLLLDEVVAHMRERVDLPRLETLKIINRAEPEDPPGRYLPYAVTGGDVPPMAAFGEGYRFHVTGLYHDQAGFPTSNPVETENLLRRLCGKVEKRRRRLARVEGQGLEDAEVVVLAYGSTARSALRAVRQAREEGVMAGLLRLITLWPFPEQAVRELAARVGAFLVPEMNLGQVFYEVERCAAGRARVVSLGRVDGELFTPREILAGLKEVAGGVPGGG